MELTRLLDERGDQVRSLIRNPDHAEEVRDAGALEAIVCDLEEADDDRVAEAVGAADVIVFAAGAGPNSGARAQGDDGLRRRRQAARGRPPQRHRPLRRDQLDGRRRRPRGRRDLRRLSAREGPRRRCRPGERARLPDRQAGDADRRSAAGTVEAGGVGRSAAGSPAPTSPPSSRRCCATAPRRGPSRSSAARRRSRASPTPGLSRLGRGSERLAAARRAGAFAASGRGSRRPAAATVQSIASQVAVATVMCTQTSRAGSSSAHWIAADHGLQGDQPDHHGERPQRPPVATLAGEDEPDGDGGDAEDRSHDRVALDDPLEGVGALEVETLDELPVVIAGVRDRRPC